MAKKVQTEDVEETEALKAEVPRGKVKVKMLKHVGEWVPGQVVEVDKPTADVLCKAAVTNDGQRSTTHQKAMLLEDAERLAKMPTDMKKLTAKQLRDMGKKNQVPTPINKAFEKELEKKKEMSVLGSDASKEAARKAGEEVSKF